MSARGSVIDSSVPDADPDIDPVVDGEDPPPDAEPEPTPEEALEARARAMGWHPLNEYRGDPKRWTSAAEFIKRGEDNLPILRDQNRRMAEKITKLDGVVTNLSKTLGEQKSAIDDLVRLAKSANQQGYERAKRELEAQRREAATAGDPVAVDQISERIAKLDETRDAVATPQPQPKADPPAPQPQAQPPEIVQFFEDNPWMNDNRFLGAQMINEHNIVIRHHPAMPLAEQLETALDALKARFPEEFGLPKATPPAPRARVAPVATPTPGNGPRRPGADPFDAITDPAERAEAKAAFTRIKRQQPDMTAVQYMLLYGDPRADVLEIQRQARKKGSNA